MTAQAKTTDSTHTRAINLRVRDETRALIDRAAQAQGRSRSDFMIEASRRAAEDAILDQAAIKIPEQLDQRGAADGALRAEPRIRIDVCRHPG